MEYLIFSDSHGDFASMIKIAEKRNPRGIIFLGDCVSDIEKVISAMPSIEYRIIKGNNDFYNNYPSEDTMRLGKSKILLCHGHNQRVKMGTAFLTQYAVEKGCDIALFGHTHIPLWDFSYGVLLFNPGSIGNAQKEKKTYGVLTVDKDDVRVSIEKF